MIKEIYGLMKVIRIQLSRPVSKQCFNSIVGSLFVVKGSRFVGVSTVGISFVGQAPAANALY
jgi:hypothetical protein